jgi:hypothetical protein
MPQVKEIIHSFGRKAYYHFQSVVKAEEDLRLILVEDSSNVLPQRPVDRCTIYRDGVGAHRGG